MPFNESVISTVSALEFWKKSGSRLGQAQAVVLCSWVRHLAPVVRKMDNAIHWINLSPLNSTICFVNTYPLDSVIHTLNNWAQVDKWVCSG